jgi:hypothetical protein
VTGVPSIRLDDAREQARLLEEVILQTRERYATADPRFVEEYLASVFEELYAVRARIDNALGIDSTRAGSASLWLRLRGGHIGDGRAPAHVVGKLLEAIQKGARQAGAYLELGTAVLHKVPKEISLDASLDMLAFAPGSARIALAPSVPQLRLDRPLPLADLALGHLVRVALWAEGAQPDERLDMLVRDPAARRQALSRVRDIAPRSQGEYTEVELSGAVVLDAAQQETFRLTPKAFGHASSFLRSRQLEAVVFGGQLVAIDIEKALFDLRYKKVRIHCFFSEELLPAAKSAIEEYVEVQGTGRFHRAGEIPYRIDATILRRLNLDEIARLR